jgi:D-allose transport system substrate-binding protein
MQKYLLFLVSLLALAACKPEKPHTDIVVLNNSTTNPYWKTIDDGFRDTAQTLGLELYIQSLNKIGDAEEQANQCENALLHKPKAIIFAAVNQFNLIPCLKKASQAGIVLVDIDGNFNEKDAKDNNLNVVFSVASSNYDLGKMAATYVVHVQGKALVIAGQDGSYPSILRVSGFKENVSATLDIIGPLPGDWDMAKASTLTTDTLGTTPDLKVVFAANDQMALGAVEGLWSQGRKDIIVIGVDGNADAVKAIKEGRLTASIAQLPYLMAKQALEKTAAYLQAPTPQVYEQRVPILTLDKEMLDRNEEPLLQYVR